MPALRHLDRYRSLALPLGLGSAACVLVLLSLHLGSEIREGETGAFDAYFLHAAQALRAAHPWVADAMRDFSGVGSMAVLTLLTVGGCGYLALSSARVTALIVAASVGTAAIGVELLKAWFGRARPDSAFAQHVATGLSFPSGHTSMSAVVFMSFGALLARRHARPAERAYIMAAASLLTILIGVSRAALGVHWATDVLGGWAFGTAWATLWLLVARHIDRSRPRAAIE